MKNHYLVTGAAGFIGSHFVGRLFNQYPDAKVTVLGRTHICREPF